MLKRIILASLISLLAPKIQAQSKSVPVYLDESRPVEQRIEDALSRMTLEEKVAMLHAQSKFSSPGVARLGIPEFWTTDGPHGVRPEVQWDEWDQAGWTNDSIVAYPALTALSATWNKKMSWNYGKALGEEARYRKKDILLGPGVNIYRTPLNGRNFEYMGEDPYLTSKMVVPYIKGVQSNGVATSVKHFALNNQEEFRHTSNVIIDDRTLYEIYLPPFKAAVQEGDSWTIMGAYDMYKNQYASQNEYLLNKILKGEWGYKGVVVSDWGAVNNTEQAIHNGLDMEFGSWTNGLSAGTKNAYDNYYLAKPYLDLIRAGKIGTTELDDKVRRILRLAYHTTMNRNKPFGNIASDEHKAVAKEIGEEGIVLLQNQRNVLPLDVNKVRKIAVIGENAIKMMTVGGGSSSLKVKYETLPLEGIKSRFGSQAEVQYARGYVGDVGGEYNGVKSGQNLKDDRSAAELLNEAVALAKNSDAVIFVGGLNKSDYQDSEGHDRKSLGLPYNQDELISALAKANKNLTVVLISGNAVAMPWVKEVPAIVQGWYLGSESGNALASVLAGDVSPSGKLPFTFPVKLEDNAAHKMGEYPGNKAELAAGKGKDQKNPINITYNEGIFVGYRWHDTKNIKPLFSFGHGLSYTTFEYGKVYADHSKMTQEGKITFTVSVKNTGKREGAEVAQLYISDLKSSVPRPVKELKGFEKISLKPGEQKEVSFTIDKSALSFFDAEKHQWVAEPGEFEAQIGSSSADIRTKVKFTLQ
ncbi:glycoside hydrolase family 3 C-terminal domain-containing protein [Elizabethkingia meningoseptica]|uniref:glycoside hydrolase family 3 C-terminal domain-containing protein n=1 Tax=Elizabethkingia meningoseptica TaxID=238 RepID=UPI0023B13251|nr:glycoside hydrolase family 3 C-terminal domain-containing protein [Elizabethkingia meningoseptica]MDE5437171.1 glycoside hydrolase family 3 C-terminal domain-containing protein [Elizabethkingia meningoseptica]MDE5509698.1 glycoside hydrolase family 3 C-terminal domain-containing protein [Elizabethkingia meningoseptica]MDE5514319.1 glycoside hydrolase family 3 C-terminal domain-containing protein [Elizabethkingia meningoseptica]MDE5524966.1 glycoside hydrolase family 3 C-terminal domain-conta